MHEYQRILGAIATDTIKGQDVTWLAAGFQPVRGDSVVRLSVAVQSAVKVKLIPSTGTGFYLNSGSALVADSVLTQDVLLGSSRSWNLATDDGSGCTVSHLIILEMSGVA